MQDSRQFAVRVMAPERFPRTLQTLAQGISEDVAPGYVAGLWQASDPDAIDLVAFGARRRVPTSLPMQIDTWFDLASVTKVMSTATLAALLVERRWIRWDQPLRAFLPEYPHKDIELRHLLSHTAGLPAWEPLFEKLKTSFLPETLGAVAVETRQKAMRELVSAVAPIARPDEQALYSDLTFLLLGFALEEATRLPLDQAVGSLLWEPLGVRDAFYRRVAGGKIPIEPEQAAATELCPWRGHVLQGEVHDDNCWAMGGYGGHAGAFGTARDVLHFARRMVGGFLSREVRDAAWTRVRRPEGCDRTLGWDTPSGAEPSASRLFSPRSVGHLGYTGTSLWIDPDAELAAVLLSNRVHPSRENARFKPFRARFHQALREDLAR